jgi:3-oxoacyl-(acyl-carrier-protein) synthase
MPDPAIGISPTSKPLLLQKNYALSTSLGFGGGNAALIIEGTKHECA